MRNHSAIVTCLVIGLITVVEGLGAPFVPGARNPSPRKNLTLKLRRRVKSHTGSGNWHVINFKEQVPPPPS